MTGLAKHFTALEDPRQPGKVAHPLTDILMVAVCAVIAGVESHTEIAGCLFERERTTSSC